MRLPHMNERDAEQLTSGDTLMIRKILNWIGIVLGSL